MDQDPKSRTQLKKEDRSSQRLGEKLVTLSPEMLDRIELPQQLREAVISARTITARSARRRQMQFIGTLMRTIDPAAIRRALDNIHLNNEKRALAFKTIEKWRDGLIAGNHELVEQILNRYPDAERQRLTQLARNAQKEAAAGKGIKSSRMLFRYLRKITEDNPA